jgi:membrane protease YdiL (CAAX protease family)
MQSRCLLILAAWYVLSVSLASIVFGIQDSIAQGDLIFPIRYIPISSKQYYLVSLFVALLSIWIMTRFVERRPFASLGLRLDPSALLLLTLGFLAIIIYKAILAYIISYTQLGLLPKWPFLQPISDLSQFMLKVLPTVIPSAYEEVIFRGYLLQTLLSGFGVLPAILVNSAIFALLHSYTSWIAYLNAGLLGFLFSSAYAKTRSLWLPIGMHIGWNLIVNYWGLEATTTSRFTGIRAEVYFLDNPIYTIGLLGVIAIFFILPLRPHPQMKALWDRYIRPAPWPPWRRREGEPHELEAPGSEV